MSSGLFSGVSGLAIGSGLYRGVSGLWSGASGLLAGWGDTYSPEALAYFAAMSVQPDDTRKALLNTLINTLISGGVWAKLDWLTIMAAHDAQAARINAKTPAEVATVVNSPTFTTDRGYTGDGATSYLNTGVNPSTAISPNYVQNSCHMGVWIGTNVQSGSQNDLGNVYAMMNSRNNPNALRYTPQLSGVIVSTYAATTSIGHSMWRRTTSLLHAAYRDGVEVHTGSNASLAVPNSSILLCASNSSTTGTITPVNYSARRVQAAHWGAQLSAGEITTLYNALATYMTAVGA